MTLEQRVTDLQRDIANLKDAYRDHEWRIECLESVNAAREPTAFGSTGDMHTAGDLKKTWHVAGWCNQHYEAFIDTDGDFGMVDNHGYSIITNKVGAVELCNAVN